MIRVAVRLDNQAVEAQVHRLLAKRGDQLALTADMAGVAEDRQIRHTTAQLDRDVPQRQVAVDFLVVRAESSVNHAQTVNARSVQTLDRPDPQLQVRIDRVLDQHGHVHALQGIGHLLHGEGVRRRTGADPQEIDPRLQRLEYMVFRSHLGRHQHARLLFYPLQPRQADGTDTLESARFRTRLPDTRAKNLNSLGCQFLGGLQHLFLCLGATRTGYHDRPLRIHALQR